MSSEILVGLLSMSGTAIGSILGLMAANKLTTYRIEQLEKKVDKHNSVVERVAIIERDIKTVFRRMDEAREDIKEVQNNAK